MAKAKGIHSMSELRAQKNLLKSHLKQQVSPTAQITTLFANGTEGFVDEGIRMALTTASEKVTEKYKLKRIPQIVLTVAILAATPYITKKIQKRIQKKKARKELS